MNKVKIVDKICLYYFFIAIPFIIATHIWSSYMEDILPPYLNYIWVSFGIIYLLWLINAFYLSFKLLFVHRFRDLVLKKVSSMKERDERENMITAEAAKAAFLSTLPLILLLTLLSSFKLVLGKHPPFEDPSRKRGYVSFGLKLQAFEKMDIVKTLEKIKEDDNNKVEETGKAGSKAVLAKYKDTVAVMTEKQQDLAFVKYYDIPLTKS